MIVIFINIVQYYITVQMCISDLCDRLNAKYPDTNVYHRCVMIPHGETTLCEKGQNNGFRT